MGYLLYKSVETGLGCAVLYTSISHSENNIVKTSKDISKVKNVLFDFVCLLILKKYSSSIAREKTLQVDVWKRCEYKTLSFLLWSNLNKSVLEVFKLGIIQTNEKNLLSFEISHFSFY